MDDGPVVFARNGIIHSTTHTHTHNSDRLTLKPRRKFGRATMCNGQCCSNRGHDACYGRIFTAMPINVSAVIPLCENNIPSDRVPKPGDIFRRKWKRKKKKTIRAFDHFKIFLIQIIILLLS